MRKVWHRFLILIPLNKIKVLLVAKEETKIYFFEVIHSDLQL